MFIMAIGGCPFSSEVDVRFVPPEYLLIPPDAEKKPVTVKEPRNWFWKRKNTEAKKKD
jgi:hypothetical protein